MARADAIGPRNTRNKSFEGIGRILLQGKAFNRAGGTRPHQVDVRIICATNQDLARMAGRNTFREDLYNRISVPCPQCLRTMLQVRFPAHRCRPLPLSAKVAGEQRVSTAA